MKINIGKPAFENGKGNITQYEKMALHSLTLENYRGYTLWHHRYRGQGKEIISTLAISPQHHTLLEEFIQENDEGDDHYMVEVYKYFDYVEDNHLTEQYMDCHYDRLRKLNIGGIKLGEHPSNAKPKKEKKPTLIKVLYKYLRDKYRERPDVENFLPRSEIEHLRRFSKSLDDYTKSDEHKKFMNDITKPMMYAQAAPLFLAIPFGIAFIVERWSAIVAVFAVA